MPLALTTATTEHLIFFLSPFSQNYDIDVKHAFINVKVNLSFVAQGRTLEKETWALGKNWFNAKEEEIVSLLLDIFFSLALSYYGSAVQRGALM